jgi:CubicO group peptidase (beta-lactamase class C family)
MTRATLKACAAAAIVLALLGVALLARSPLFWRRYIASHLAPAAAAPGWYQPRELLKGGNEPPAPRVAPELEALDGRALENAASYAAAHHSRALIVSRHDHIVFERYWDGTGFDTVTDAGGFTPILAALATGVAVAHRVIAWPDQPLRYFVPAWRSEPRGAITLRNLMQQTSGLEPPAPSGLPWSPYAQQRFGTDFTAAVLAEPLTAQPGSTRRPQPADPQLLALAIEQASRQRYADYVSQTLWRRLGAADAWLWLDRRGGSAHADCCLLAQQGDWIRVGQLLASDGRYRGAELLRPGWVPLLRAPARAAPDYGAGVRIGARAAGASEPYATPDLFVLDGTGGSRMWIVPSLQLVVLRIAAPGATDAGWDDARVPNAVVRAARDYLPPAARPGGDVSTLVPGH